jgi:site-specific recombinase XerD
LAPATINRRLTVVSESYEWLQSVMNKIIRPLLAEAGIVGKTIGWHSFRHSLATNLRSMGVDVKVAQELLRHANSRITLDLYTRAVSTDKREASGNRLKC